MRLRDHSREFHRAVQGATLRGLVRATVYYHQQCQAAVSVPNSGKRRGGRTVYPNPSRPGEPPRLRTGFGRSSIVWESNDDPDDPATRVGVRKNGLYMFHLDRGTVRIAARPWLVATLEERLSEIAALLQTERVR